MKLIVGLATCLTIPIVAWGGSLSHSTRTVHKGKKGWWDALALYPVFPEHTPVLDLATKSLDANAKSLVAKFIKLAPTFVYNGKPNPPFAFDSSFTISYAAANLLSLTAKDYQDVGGAHPSYYLQLFTFGVVHGRAKKLVLQDLFKPSVHAERQMNEFLMAALRTKGASFVVDGTVEKLTHEQLCSFVVTTHGLDFVFSPYEVASWAEGPQEVDLKFSEIKGLDPSGPLRGIL